MALIAFLDYTWYKFCLFIYFWMISGLSFCDYFSKQSVSDTGTNEKIFLASNGSPFNH